MVAVCCYLPVSINIFPFKKIASAIWFEFEFEFYFHKSNTYKSIIKTYINTYYAYRAQTYNTLIGVLHRQPTSFKVITRARCQMFTSLLEAHALPRASGPRQRTRNPRQRLCRGPFIGHSAKPLPRARIALGKEKTPSDAGAVGGFFAEGRPSAKKWFLFFFKSLPRADPRQIKVFIFFKSLPRASSMALGKEIFRIF